MGPTARSSTRAWTTAVVLALLPWLLVPGAGGAAYAAFGDSAAATTSFSSYVVPKPGSPACGHLLNLVANASWSTVAGGTGFLVSVNGGTAVSQGPTNTTWSALIALNTVVTVRTQVGTWTSLPVTFTFPAGSGCSIT